MESAAKRKAASGAAAENDTRAAKRQKVPAEAAREVDTPETTREKGLRFLESLKVAKDKNGRPIATHFLTLPDEDELPEYYQEIKLPISIETMEDKLNRGEYPSLSELESDCKRLINNAKQFNEKKSIVYEDAERLRKTASNWMTKNNPAYKTIKNYSALPTPIPGEEGNTPARPTPRAAASTPRPAPATPDTMERPRRAAAPVSSTPIPSRLRQSASAAPSQHSQQSPSFAGKSFQEAQEQIINELIDYVDPGSNTMIFHPFVNLPSRALKDYYTLIKTPMSLSKVRKLTQGITGRPPGTGETVLKSWSAFEDEVSLIWDNARAYNEDGSEIYTLSLRLEKIFKQRLADAKAKVDEPPQPKLKINMSQPKQQIKIKLRNQSPGSDPNTPGTRSSATPGVTVDNEALLRQQRHVHDSMSANRSSSSKPQSPLVASTPVNGTRSQPASTVPVASALKTAASPPAVNGIKNDVQSPALNSIRPASMAPDGRPSVPAQTPHAAMPPPQSMTRGSGSPLPPIQNGLVPAGGMQPNGHIATPGNYYPPAYYVPPPPPPTQDYIFRKTPLRNSSDALIPKVTISTAPSLNLSKPFRMAIPADKRKTVQSITLSLPTSHSHLHIVPYLPVALDGRGYRVFYMLNGKPYSETPRITMTPSMTPTMNGGTPSYDGGKKKGEPLYEAKLQPGLNKIEIEVVAEKKGKPETKDPKDVIDVEKCLIFVNLIRSS